jgi:putative glutathione S-transferase
VSLACPWAHRTLIMRGLKGLEEMIGVSVVHWRMLENGWTFEEGPGVVPDPIDGARYLHQVYTAAKPDYTGRVTVPVLRDRATGAIVNNESSDIIRMMNAAFDGIGAKPGDYYPQALRPEIDALNARIYDTVNNGVYKAGFATAQDAYEEAVRPLFDTLDVLDERLSSRRYLCGDRLTEADLRLFTTLVRFDPVYVGHFKCNLRRIADYPHLSGYLRDLYQIPGVAETVNMAHIKGHYYESHGTINPTGIVPLGPILDLDAPHGRERLQGR